MIDVENTALVLEGGGMRGVFTCGVLDYLMEADIRFPFVVGVSAGSGNGLSYISNQPGRAKKTNIDLLEEYQYLGWKNFFLRRNFIDHDFLYRKLPEEILPFDYDTYFGSSQRFVMVTTNCKTGKAEYLEEKNDKKKLLDICKASSSLPFICPKVKVDDMLLLDGGIADSIPVEYALNQGYKYAVVILTRNEGYRKEENSSLNYFSSIYRKYPELRKALKRRSEMYNAQMELVERLEKEGKITVIRPMNPIRIGRLGKDIRKLTKMYDEGYFLGVETFRDNTNKDHHYENADTDNKIMKLYPDKEFFEKEEEQSSQHKKTAIQ